MVVALTAERHGVEGVILATMMAGIFLMAAGFLRLGTYIKFIPLSGTGSVRRHHASPDRS